jgi:riboflavin transporter FmnP
MKTISYFSHLGFMLAIVTGVFALALLFLAPNQAFLRVFGTFYYFFFNGFFLYRLYYPYEKLDFIQIFSFSLLLSTCVNSLSVYILNRTISMPFTLQNTTFTATTLLGLILLGHVIRYKRILL